MPLIYDEERVILEAEGWTQGLIGMYPVGDGTLDEVEVRWHYFKSNEESGLLVLCRSVKGKRLAETSGNDDACANIRAKLSIPDVCHKQK